MPFEFFELEDNWQPNVALDPYHRKHIRIRYTLQDGEKMADAENTVKQYIQEYIKKNTVDQPHIVERYIHEDQLPVIQLDRGPSLEDQIRSCTELKVLKIYESFTKGNPILQEAYNQTMSNLTIK